MVSQSSKSLLSILHSQVIDLIQTQTGLFSHDGLCLTSWPLEVYVGAKAKATSLQDGFRQFSLMFTLIKDQR